MIVMQGHGVLAMVDQRAKPQSRHHLRKTKQAVKIGAADPDPVIAQNIAVTVGFTRAFRGDAQDGKVGGAAADIGDQDQLFVSDSTFIV